MSRIQVVGKKSVFTAKLFEVEELQIQERNGKKEPYHIVKRHPTVAVFPITDRYEIYLVSQYRHLYDKVMVEAMAGFIEEGETTLRAGKRELQEETGISAGYWEEFARVELAGSVIRATTHLFFAKDLVFGEAAPDEDEEIEVIKLPLRDAVTKVMIGEIQHAPTMTGILMLERLRSEKKI